MVTMSGVWDRTSEVLAGRTSMLAAIAIPTLFVPTVIRDAYVAYATPGTAGFAAIGGVLSIIVALITIWGQLALIAAASDPTNDKGASFQIARGRILPAIGVSIVIMIAVFLTLLPALVLLGVAGVDFEAIGSGQRASQMPIANGGALAGAILYMVVWAIAILFVSARLTIWQAVLVNERNGLRAIPRAWALSRGATWRIVGVILLFGIVLLVAAGAAQSVVGIVFRLLLGADNVATSVFLASIAGSLVTTPLLVLAVVFTAQLYLACRGERDPIAPADVDPA
jgi:hypothetical protein